MTRQPPPGMNETIAAEVERLTPTPVPHLRGSDHTLRLAVAAVLEADKEFRSNMMPGWEGDPLSDEIDGLRRIFEASPTPEPHLKGSLQSRVQPWMMACFGQEISADKLERGDRLLEEVFELLQSGDYPRERIRALEDYTWSRPKGEPHQEVGGVNITLAAYCLAHGLDMHQAGEDELARIWTKVEKIRAKQAAKPTGSALPIAALAAEGSADA